MVSFGKTDKGKVRKNNEDSYIIENCDKRKCAVVVVCDGMGGANAGETASRLACKEFASRLYAALVSPSVFPGGHERLLKDACADANGVVHDYAEFEPECSGMGTTLVGGVVYKNRAHIVNVGDSRAYHITENGIRQITRDHSYVEELVAAGAITREEAINHPRKNVITRALGVDAFVEADYFDVPLDRGDCVLLCSDGLSNMVSNREMYEIFLDKHSPDAVCEELMRLALDRGARDNVTLAVVRV